MDKPRILLVYDFHGWVLGTWARTIAGLFADEFDFILASLFLYTTNEAFFARLIDQMDAVHLLLPHSFDQFRPITRGRPLITTFHHWVAWGGVYQRAIDGSEHLVTGAVQWKRRLMEKGVPEGRITVVHHGVADRFLERVPPLLPPSARTTLGFFAKASSNEGDRKGTRHLRALVECLRERGRAGLFRFVVAGPGWDGYVQDMAAAGIDIVHAGFLDDERMPALYQSLDAYLVLSDVEGGPATIAEAMASRCMVLSTPVGAAPDILADGDTGIFIDTTDIPGLAGTLERLAAEPDRRTAIAERAHAHALACLRAATTFAPLRPLYRALTDGRTGEGRQPLDAAALNAAISHLSPDPR